MTAPSQEQARIAALDGVRGIAILLVLVMHGLYIGPLLGLDVAAHPYARLAWLGWSGVDVFFVLSGFLITGILVRSKGSRHYFRNFYVRRALRIFPLYYLVIGLLLFVLARPATTGGEKLSYLLYYQNIRYALFGEQVMDPARLITWSLAIEEQFYLVWPALVALVSTRALRGICLAVIVGAIALRSWLLSEGLAGTHFLTPCRMDALAAGALLAITPPPRAVLGWLATGLGLGGLVATAWWTGASTPESLGQQRWGLFAALSLGVGLLTLARRERRLQWLFTQPMLRSLGKYSYCIYLTHILVIEHLASYVQHLAPDTLAALRSEWSPMLTTMAFTIVAIAVSWLVAVVSWQVFERWFLWLKRYFPAGG